MADRSGYGSTLAHLLAAVLAAALAAGMILAFRSPASGSSGGFRYGTGTVPSPASRPALLGTSEQAIVAKVRPGTVLINTKLQYNSEAAAGTGMVLNASGLVLTNNHVIANSTAITATVPATGKTYQARVVGYDKTGDIALIQLQGASGLATIPVGDSSLVRAGQPVVAMGNAGGHGTVRVSAGQVTKLNVTIMASDQEVSAAPEILHGVIQTSADIVAGDSGGPLSGPGGVIGMDTAGGDSGYPRKAAGFAIAINTALSVARQIAVGQPSSAITIGYPPFMGIFIGDRPDPGPRDQAGQQARQPFARSSPGPACSTTNADLTPPPAIAPVTSGALVEGAICGGPAARAGFTGGAVITAVNGQPVRSPDGLSAIMARFHPGDTTSVTWVSPSGQRKTSRIRLIDGPPQ